MNITFEIPRGFTELLQDFTVAVMRSKPQDVVDFAVQYFTNIKKQQRISEKTSGKPTLPKIGGGGGIEFSEVFKVLETDSKKQQIEDDEESESSYILIEPPPRNEARKSVAAERFDPEDDLTDSEKVVHPKTDEQRKRLAAMCNDTLLFKSLDDEDMDDVIDAMFSRIVKPGERVITQGEEGDNFYVIEYGNYDVLIETDGIEKKVYSFDDKGSFGELALMYNCPRTATVQACTKGYLWAMDRITFKRIVLKRAFQKRQMFDHLIETVPIFNELNFHERNSVSDALISVTFSNGQTIIKQDDIGKEMYFIMEGDVAIKRRNQEGQEVEIVRLTKGAYFGELSLVTKKTRAASVYSLGTTKLAKLDVDSFERLLGPCLELMKRNIDNYKLPKIN